MRITIDKAGRLVIPKSLREQSGITVVKTDFQHNDMRDTGPDAAKSSIQSMLDKFIDESDKSGALKPVPTRVPDILAANPGPVPLSVPPAVPLASNRTPGKPVTN